MNKNCFGKRLHYLLVMMLSIFSLIAGAQGYNTTDWRFSNPQKFGFTVFDLDFVDNNNVIAVGSEGGIARSTDGGATWTYGVFTYNTPTGYLSFSVPGCTLCNSAGGLCSGCYRGIQYISLSGGSHGKNNGWRRHLDKCPQSII